VGASRLPGKPATDAGDVFAFDTPELHKRARTPRRQRRGDADSPAPAKGAQAAEEPAYTYALDDAGGESPSSGDGSDDARDGDYVPGLTAHTPFAGRAGRTPRRVLTEAEGAGGLSDETTDDNESEGDDEEGDGSEGEGGGSNSDEASSGGGGRSAGNRRRRREGDAGEARRGTGNGVRRQRAALPIRSAAACFCISTRGRGARSLRAFLFVWHASMDSDHNTSEL